MGTIIPANRASFTFDEVLSLVHGQWMVGDRAQVCGVSTDTRRIHEGNAFVALVGERFDGHDHLHEAAKAGASVLITSRQVPSVDGTAVVQVSDTLEALGRLAKAHRLRWARKEGRKVVGITGSAGKTTTCRTTAAVLDALCEGEVHRSAGNLNNAIGVPMVLLGLESRHELAVVEIGTNAPGEVAYGAGLTKPDLGVLTLVACAHTQGLGTIEAVAEEKGALFESLEKEGIAVANLDDPHVVSQLYRAKGAKIIGYGRSAHADVRILDTKSEGWQGQEVRIGIPGQREMTFRTPLLGAAGQYACCAALGVALGIWEKDLDIESALGALESMTIEQGRLQPRQLRRGAVLIDDAYNANPASMRDSIDVAAGLAQGDRRLVLVLGEMRELGAQSVQEHRRVGEHVARIRPALLVAVGGDARHCAEVAFSSGISSLFVKDAASAIGPVVEGVGDRDVILVKGSRGVALESVVRSLEAWGEEQGS